VIKLIPPLMIGEDEVKLFTEAFGEVLEDASRGSGLIWEFGRTLVKQAVRGLPAGARLTRRCPLTRRYAARPAGARLTRRCAANPPVRSASR
jgi:hypothetical protein